MKKILFTLAFVSCFYSFSYSETRELPSKLDYTSMTERVVVQKIDAATRVVTVRKGDGEFVEINAGPEVKNFNQIKIGDNVVISNKKVVVISVESAGKGPEEKLTTESHRAKLGERPFGRTESLKESRMVVDAIDYDKRLVTLRNEEKVSKEYPISPEVVHFENVKVGDEVVVKTTEAFSIEVEE